MTKYGAKSLIVFVLVALFLFYEMGVQVSPSVMTHQLMQALHIDAVGLGFMSGVYFYTYTAMQIPAGLLLDRFGVRRIVATALLVCAAGSACFGMAGSIVGGIAARLLTGFGSAFAFVSVLAVAERWFHKKYFALLAGMAQLFAAFGAMGGQLPMAYFVDHYGWRHTLFGLSIVSLVLAALIGIFVKEAPKRECEDIRHCDDGVRDKLGRLFKNPQTWFVAFYAFLNWAPMAFFASLWGVPFLRATYHMTNPQAAFYSSLIWIGIAVGAPLMGFLSDYIGRRNILLQLSTFVGFLSALSVLYGGMHSPVVLGVLMFLLGASCAGQVLSFAVVKDSAPANGRATAIAINNMAVVASGALMQPLVGILLKRYTPVTEVIAQASYSAPAYHQAMIVLPLVYGIGLLVSLFFIRETYCK